MVYRRASETASSAQKKRAPAKRCALEKAVRTRTTCREQSFAPSQVGSSPESRKRPSDFSDLPRRALRPRDARVALPQASPRRGFEAWPRAPSKPFTNAPSRCAGRSATSGGSAPGYQAGDLWPAWLRAQREHWRAGRGTAIPRRREGAQRARARSGRIGARGSRPGSRRSAREPLIYRARRQPGGRLSSLDSSPLSRRCSVRSDGAFQPSIAARARSCP